LELIEYGLQLGFRGHGIAGKFCRCEIQLLCGVNFEIVELASAQQDILLSVALVFAFERSMLVITIIKCGRSRVCSQSRTFRFEIHATQLRFRRHLGRIGSSDKR